MLTYIVIGLVWWAIMGNRGLLDDHSTWYYIFLWPLDLVAVLIDAVRDHYGV